MSGPVRFGVFLSPEAARRDDVVAQARLADEAGLDLIGIQDHPYHPGFLDAWALAGHLLACTSRIRVFPDVANLPLRSPAMMAKQAASLDLLSGGRFDLGLGAGAANEAAAAMGGARRSPGEAVEALDEAVDILRRAWSGDGPVHHTGHHYRLDGYEPGPPPAHRIGIWIGGYGPRMLDLVGRRADGWVPSMPYLPPDRAAEAQRRIDEAARRAGRQPADISRIYNIDGTIGGGPAGNGRLGGPPEAWAEALAGLVLDVGFDTFVLAPGQPEPEQIERFASEVVPLVRDAVAAAR